MYLDISLISNIELAPLFIPFPRFKKNIERLNQNFLTGTIILHRFTLSNTATLKKKIFFLNPSTFWCPLTCCDQSLYRITFVCYLLTQYVSKIV